MIQPKNGTWSLKKNITKAPESHDMFDKVESILSMCSSVKPRNK